MVYDYGIIGAGAAGLQLALAMLDDPWFSSKEIVILDKDRKQENDKTWCYWEIGTGKWDELVHKSWQFGKFITNEHKEAFDLDPYRYKMLRSLDFYRYARQRLEQAENFTWLYKEVSDLKGEGPVSIITIDGNSIPVGHCFDSRIEPKSLSDAKKQINLLQHFVGWMIRTADNTFDPDSFTIMDYRPRLASTTSFMYVLPISDSEALIEYTFFSPSLVDEEVYEEALVKYIRETLGIQQFEIWDTEQGIIPMTTYPFHHSSRKGLTKIGTAGSWVKGSSGYSFANAGRKVDQVICNVKSGKSADHQLIKPKFRYYDRLLLDVLYRNNDLGESIFTEMYTRNSIQDIFQFLDEKTSLQTDFKIISTFEPWPFMAAMLRSLV